MNRNMALGIAVSIAIILGGAALWYFLHSSHNLPSAPEPVSVGMYPSEGSALVYIAEDQGFFSENGLAVTVRDYDPPSMGIKAAVGGDVDIAGATEYPVVMNILTGGNFSILAQYDELESMYLIARKDHGITNISDLRGKKIGVPRGTIAEFNLGRFLTLHNLGLRDVTLVDVQPPQFAESIRSGSVDALICWQPPASQIAGQMGDQVLEWPAQSGQPLFGVIIARDDWIAREPARTARFLKSLDMAAEYTNTHPAESRAIVQKRLNLSNTYMDVMWPANHFSLSLDQSLVLAMEDEARWMIANNMTNATVVPDFRKYIYTKSLEEIEPGSVRIFG